jgi:hypothetical protein
MSTESYPVCIRRRCDGEAASKVSYGSLESGTAGRRHLPLQSLISIEPILALPGVRPALQTVTAPVVAVAPIIGGEAVKGPTAKMMRELGLEVSAKTVAQQLWRLPGWLYRR